MRSAIFFGGDCDFAELVAEGLALGGLSVTKYSGDLSDLIAMKTAAKGHQFVVYFPMCDSDRNLSLAEEVMAIMNSLEAASGCGAERYLLALLGDGSWSPLELAVELTAESFVKTYQIEQGLTFTVLRYSCSKDKELAVMTPEILEDKYRNEFVFLRKSLTDTKSQRTNGRELPEIGHKLVASDHVELGQGLLDCLADLHEELSGSPSKI